MRELRIAFSKHSGKLRYRRSAHPSYEMTPLLRNAKASLTSSQLDQNGFSKPKRMRVDRYSIKHGWRPKVICSPIGETHMHRLVFRYLISMATSHRLGIDHLDVVTAPLNPEVDDLELVIYRNP